MERTFVPKNRIKINIALAYLLLGTQGVEPCQLKDQIGVYHVFILCRWLYRNIPMSRSTILLSNMTLFAKRTFISLHLHYNIALFKIQMRFPSLQ